MSGHFCFRIGEDFLHRTNFCQFPMIHNCHTVTYFFHHRHLMGNDYHRQLQLLVYSFQKYQNLLRNFRVQCAGGLITQKHLRIHGQCSGNGNTLPLPAGKLCRISFCLVCQSNNLQHFQSTLFPLFPVHLCYFHR